MEECFMEKSTVQASFQLMDNYISDFSLKVFNKINSDRDLGINANIGFRIVNINEKELIGQIELKYDLDIVDNEIKEENNKVAKINMTMHALFKGTGDIDSEKFEEMLRLNGATTLSHLCRAYINNTTALSGMPTITMPLINFSEFFENAVEKTEEHKIKEN